MGWTSQSISMHVMPSVCIRTTARARTHTTSILPEFFVLGCLLVGLCKSDLEAQPIVALEERADGRTTKRSSLGTLIHQPNKISLRCAALPLPLPPWVSPPPSSSSRHRILRSEDIRGRARRRPLSGGSRPCAAPSTLRTMWFVPPAPPVTCLPVPVTMQSLCLA